MKLDFYLKGITSIDYDNRRRHDDDTIKVMSDISITDQLEILKERFWMTVFDRARISCRLTEKFKRNFSTFRRQQKDMAFSIENIEEMLYMFFGNYNEIMLRCLVEVFDSMTSFYPENKVHIEGWKSNHGHKVEQYKLNYKVVHPYGVNFCKILERFECNHCEGFLTDLDKVLCWIEGINFLEMSYSETSHGVLRHRCSQVEKNSDRSEYGQKIYSKYLEMQFWKKGTLHLRFRDTELLKEFNVRAAQGKKWIGGEGY